MTIETVRIVCSYTDLSQTIDPDLAPETRVKSKAISYSGKREWDVGEQAYRSEIVAALKQMEAFRESSGCLLLEFAVSTYRYRPTRDDSRLREQLMELARERPPFGYRRLHVMLPTDQHVNHKRDRHVYCQAGLAVKRRKRKRLVRVGLTLEATTVHNEEWALDLSLTRSRPAARSVCSTWEMHIHVNA